MTSKPLEDFLLWDSERTCKWLRSVGLGKFVFPVKAEQLRMLDLIKDVFANPKRQKQYGIQNFHVKKFERAVSDLANKIEENKPFARPEDPVVNVPTILQSEHTAIGETFHIENPSPGLTQSEGQSRSKHNKKDPSQSLTHHQPVQSNTTSLNRAYGTQAEMNDITQINAQMHGINVNPQQQQFNFSNHMSISPVNMASPRMVQPPPQNTQQFVNQHTTQANSNLPQLIQESAKQLINIQQQMATLHTAYVLQQQHHMQLLSQQYHQNLVQQGMTSQHKQSQQSMQPQAMQNLLQQQQMQEAQFMQQQLSMLQQLQPQQQQQTIYDFGMTNMGAQSMWQRQQQGSSNGYPMNAPMDNGDSSNMQKSPKFRKDKVALSKSNSNTSRLKPNKFRKDKTPGRGKKYQRNNKSHNAYQRNGQYDAMHTGFDRTNTNGNLTGTPSLQNPMMNAYTAMTNGQNPGPESQLTSLVNMPMPTNVTFNN